MLAGHIAFAFAGKRLAPAISLGTLVLASLAADLLWCILLIAGVEQVQIRPGHTTQDSLVAIRIPYSHGLLMDALWAVLFAAVYFTLRRSVRGAGVVAAVVLSHWALDFLSHRPDMPLAPGSDARFGLALWDSIPATLVVEGGFWVAAAILYAHATRSKRRAGVYGFWGGVLLLTVVWWNNVAGPPPAPNAILMAVSSLIFFSLVTAWAYAIDRLRVHAPGSSTG